MRLLDAVFDDGVRETWRWLTDAMVSDNGTEQRVCNSSLPRRSFGASIKFDDATELRRQIAGLLIGSKDKFQLPLYQYQTRLKAPAAIGDNVISILTGRTELRVGNAALVFDRTGFELVVISALDSVSATFVDPLTRAYSTKASICPVAAVYAANRTAIDYGIMDDDGHTVLNITETGFLDPFLNEFNDAEVALFNGLPILTERPTGTTFSDAFDTGIQINDEGGQLDVRSPWTHSQIQSERTYLCQRRWNPAQWDYWRAFADAVKGSWKPFYAPTYRQDFGVVVPPAPGGNTLTFAGTSYAEDWFPFAPFKALAISSDGGMHYSTVTGAAVVGDNSVVTLGTALPVGVLYSQNQRISLLQKVRIADDQIVCDHSALNTELTLSYRTVDA